MSNIVHTYFSTYSLYFVHSYNILCNIVATFNTNKHLTKLYLTGPLFNNYVPT